MNIFSPLILYNFTKCMSRPATWMTNTESGNLYASVYAHLLRGEVYIMTSPLTVLPHNLQKKVGLDACTVIHAPLHAVVDTCNVLAIKGLCTQYSTPTQTM